jgi:hypothetical protein
MSNNDSRGDMIAWVGWHVPELAGVLVPTALAATVSPWFVIPAVLVAAGWTAHEIRVDRQQRGLRPTAESQMSAEHTNPTDQTEESAS